MSLSDPIGGYDSKDKKCPNEKSKKGRLTIFQF